MSDDKDNFIKWYVNALAPLRSNGDAGFIFAIVTLPLLERYLREKSKTGQANSLPERFFVELGQLLPDIADKTNDFWQCYRNGLLHQATFSKGKLRGGVTLVMPSAGLSGGNLQPVYFDASTKSFYMNPVAFFDLVTSHILSDFGTYLGSLSIDHKLPYITPMPTPSMESGPLPGYLGATGSYNP